MESDIPKAPPVNIISDAPASEQFKCGYTAYARTLSGLIANKENTTPLVMGIHGSWGSGKTTLMKAIRSSLDGDGFNEAKEYRYCKTVWFQAWQYDPEEPILVALIESIFKAMAADGFFGLAKSKIEAISRRIDKSKIFTSVTQLISGMDVSEFFSGLENKEKLIYCDTFQKFFDDLVWTFLNWRFKLTGEEKPDDKQAALVIFIDDLDRCTQPLIVRVLETIHGLMERSGSVFVIGADSENIENALAQSYGRQQARSLFEKLFQINFTLTPLGSKAFEGLLDCKKQGMATLKAYLPLITPAVGCNPRQLKRFINHMNLLHGLMENSNARLDLDKIMVWGIIQSVFGGLADHIKENPETLFMMQEQVKQLSAQFPETPLWQISEAQLIEEKVPQALRSYLRQPHLAELVERLEMTPEALGTLQAFSAVVFKPAYA